MTEMTCRRKRGRNVATKLHFTEDRAFVDGFARFVENALKNGNAVIVVAIESPRASPLQRLSADGVEVNRAVRQNRYGALDAAPDSLYYHVA